MRAEVSTKDKPIVLGGLESSHIYMLQLFLETYFFILSSLSCKMERNKFGHNLPLFLPTLTRVFYDNFDKFKIMQK